LLSFATTIKKSETYEISGAAEPGVGHKRLPAEMQAELANYDLNRLPETGFLIRGKGEAIRAVLSDRYAPYNNHEVIEAAEATVKDHELMVRSFALEDCAMFLKLTTSTLTDRTLELKAGVMIGNSEVGFAQVTVEPFLYRQESLPK